ncbi:glycosyltransferase [Microbacterium gorillae]|uniref:glycosyltransferase n=1 Tax=Microbacterium gorillae TaxID=1231063 RepID=UPI00058D723E|nr:glycosyltransferase [Microbacterium gorillae]
MPAPVHAVVVARPDTRGAGLAHLQATLAAIAAQRHPVDALTIVLCGRDPRFAAVANASGAEGVVQADASVGYAEAIELASKRVAGDRDLWLLAQDTLPEPEALGRLAGVLELADSVALVAPKLVRRDAPEMIASLGVSMSRGGEAVELAAGQFDQGQHDRNQDVLGSDIRGVLLRAQRRGDLLPDRALGGADEGLDLGVRARLAGHRVAMAPDARVQVSGDGVAGLPDPERAADRRRIAFSTRLAQLHRRLTYAPAVVVPLHILSFLPIALWRALVDILNKRPDKLLPEWAATFLAAFRWGAIARSRKHLRGERGEWWRVDSLRVTRAQRREILQSDDGEPTRAVRGEMRFFSGGGFWVVLVAAVAGALAFPMLLASPVMGGGGALPLRSGLGELWGDTLFGLRGYGVDQIAPADPFAALLAVLGSVTPAMPSTALVIAWVLALPLAALGGWFAVARVTERSGLRLVGAALYALAPSFLSALIDPRPAAVLAHLLLPWLFYAGVIAHRSWGASGAASILLLAVAACSPVIGALVFVVVVVGILFALGWRRFTSAGRLLWMLVPTAVAFLPILWRAVADHRPLTVFADPGLPYQGARAGDDLMGRLATVTGFSDGAAGGWPTFLHGLGLDAFAGYAPWIVVVIAPVALLALLAPFTPRWRVGTSLLLLGAALLVGALLVSHVSLTVVAGSPVTMWPGTLAGAGWLALIAAAVLALDGLRLPRAVVGVAASLSVLLIVAAAVPSLTAVSRGEAKVTSGPRSTLPAYVAAELNDGLPGSTLVLSILADGSVAERVVWGSSDTQGAQSTALNTRTDVTADDTALAAVIADLMTPSSQAGAQIARSGVRFILLEPVGAATGPASELRTQAISALNQNGDLQAIGETGRGALWTVSGKIAPRAELSATDRTISTGLALALLVVLAIAVLLAIPTRGSVRASRAKPRGIGVRGGDE